MAVRNRSEIMEEISRIDARINELAGQVPMARSSRVIPFPWGSWILAVIMVGTSVYGDGTLLTWAHPVLYQNRYFILTVGSVIGLWAVDTVRSLFFTGHWQKGSNRRVSAQIETLRQERTVLAQQLRQLGAR